MSRLVLVLGDQLTPGLASLAAADPDRDLVLMGELKREAEYAWHHKKKLAFIFSAMRHFAKELEGLGWRVRYQKFNDDGAAETFTALVSAAARKMKFNEILVVEAGEHRVEAELKALQEAVGAPVRILEDDRFVSSRTEFAGWAEGRKALRLEYFYREMRRKTGLLMEGDEPAGGKWNYDAENRKPPKDGLDAPARLAFEPDAISRDVLRLVAARFPDNFGDLEPFSFATTRAEAEKARDYFMKAALPRFGDYQDAMLKDEKFLFHSLLSPYLNIGLLDPLDLCRRAEAEWRKGHAPLNAAEGFIRQIIGWREYVRGVYFLEGEDYVRANFFGAERPLPEFYWTGETEMACVKSVVAATRAEAYAHHIQRLMVTGNFALLAGIDPHAVHEWYLAVYADAYEWVEAPNTIGMSQFADGGRLGSKPYVSSGAYIDRMSDYCGGCRYDVKKKTEDGACPFNALYWDFLLRNERTLARNPRLARAYQTFARMAPETRDAYRRRAADILDRLDRGERI